MLQFGRTSSVEFGNPDFVAYARAYGALGFRVEGPSELLPILKEALHSGRPAIIDCPVDYEENMRLAERPAQKPS
jgi:acetolactate synthase-1/2/3 large subunit